MRLTLMFIVKVDAQSSKQAVTSAGSLPEEGASEVGELLPLPDTKRKYGTKTTEGTTYELFLGLESTFCMGEAVKDKPTRHQGPRSSQTTRVMG